MCKGFSVYKLGTSNIDLLALECSNWNFKSTSLSTTSIPKGVFIFMLRYFLVTKCFLSCLLSQCLFMSLWVLLSVLASPTPFSLAEPSTLGHLWFTSSR